MMSRYFLSGIAMISIAFLCSIAKYADAQNNFPCNPGAHCDPRSTLCKSNTQIRAMLLGEPEPPVSFETSRGVCSDAFRWICNRDGTQCRRQDYTDPEIMTRCQNILFTDRSRRDQFKAEDFIEACRAGRFTCNDGRCVQRAGQCGTSGVRYGQDRCALNECGDENILSTDCVFDDNVETVDTNKECVGNHSGSFTTCCVRQSSPECEYLEAVPGSIDVEPVTCGGVCPPDQCPQPHPYWALNGPNGGGGGGADYIGGGGVQIDSIDSIIDGSINIEDEFRRDVTSIEIKWEIDQESKQDCCCRLSCDCFGDPHCTDFFGRQETSKISDGSYSMYDVGDFNFHVELGEPQGILTDVYVRTHEMPDTEFRLSVKDCQNMTHNWRNRETGEFVRGNDLPESWTTRFTQGDVFTDPTTYVVRDQVAQVSAEIRCLDFFWLENPRSPDLIPGTRLDITITKWSDLAGDGCCPTLDQHREWFQERDASGYCVQERSLPQSLPNGRRLDESSRRGLSESPNGVVRGALGEKENEQTFNNLNDERAQALCEAYLELIDAAGIAAIAQLENMDKCMLNVLDFGLQSLQALIDRLRNEGPQCIVDINDQRLRSPFRACELGMTLQVQGPGENNWRDYRFFRFNDRFCDNRIIIDFTRAYDADAGRFLNANYKFRFRRCSPDPAICGSCNALVGFRKIEFRYLYECDIYNTYKSFAFQDLYNAFRDGFITCGFAYENNPDPFACLRVRFPDLFGLPSSTFSTLTRPINQGLNINHASAQEDEANGLPSKRCREVKQKQNCLRFPWCRWTNDGRCLVRNVLPKDRN